MEKIEQIKKDALSYPARARTIIVHNNDTLEIANNFILSMKEMMKEVSESYGPIIRHAQAEKKKYFDPLAEAQGIARMHVTSYLEDQAEIQKKADEKARKIEEDRQKKETEALERAKKYQDQKMEEEADAIIEDIPLPAQAPEPPPPKPAGLSLKRIVDTEKINLFVATTKGQAQIPGIRIYPVWKWEIDDRKLIPSSYYKSSMAQKLQKRNRPMNE
ncbi:unnamed protein product, partial [marine sediment metagenome]